MKKTMLLLALFTLLGCSEAPPPLWSGFAEAKDFKKLTRLPKSIKESSGLVYWQRGLWTLNDSGDGPYLYQVNTQQKEEAKAVKVGNIDNIDWESLSEDSTHFLIGDFGNNEAIRTNLAIHLVDKKTIISGGEELSAAQSISFSYEDQEVGLFPQRGHNFDCEAMVATGDSIYLFSKNHGNKKCTIYSLPKIWGQQVAKPTTTFDTKGKITGAALVAESSLLVLLGYNQSIEGHKPFVWVFSDFPKNDFFAGKAERLQLPGYLQTEGIAHFQGTQFFVTNEAEAGAKASIYLLDVKDVINKR